MYFIASGRQWLNPIDLRRLGLIHPLGNEGIQRRIENAKGMVRNFLSGTIPLPLSFCPFTFPISFSSLTRSLSTTRGPVRRTSGAGSKGLRSTFREQALEEMV